MKKISEILKEEREKKGYTLDQVENVTKIKKEFLKSIEEGEFNNLPSESYALGFVKSYANFLGLPLHKTTALFRREYKEEKHEFLPKYRKNSEEFKKNPIFNSKNILISSIFVVILGYIIFQYNSLIFGPPLSVSTPKNGEVINSNVVQVSGKTEQYATILIDQEEVSVGIDGTFKKSIYVFPGEKNLTIISKNRFGKEKSIVLNVTVK